jgi:hypothetical protein
MADLITFVAVSGGFALFGMAEDPAARVAQLQAGSPLPIELAGGWIVPPQDRVTVMDRVTRQLSDRPRHGDWIKVPREKAVALLDFEARWHDGQPWQIRKRPRPTEAPDNAHHRAVVTPRGRFPSAAGAAEAHGISRQAAWERATRRAGGWRFEDDDSPPPPPARRGRPPKEKSQSPV